MSKRTNPVKVMLSDEELANLNHQSQMQGGRPLADILRETWLRDIWGSVGLAMRRAKRNRGSSEFPETRDFEPTGWGDGA